jgi:hypothetical protein
MVRLHPPLRYLHELTMEADKSMLDAIRLFVHTIASSPSPSSR